LRYFCVQALGISNVSPLSQQLLIAADSCCLPTAAAGSQLLALSSCSCSLLLLTVAGSHLLIFGGYYWMWLFRLIRADSAIYYKEVFMSNLLHCMYVIFATKYNGSQLQQSNNLSTNVGYTFDNRVEVVPV